MVATDLIEGEGDPNGVDEAQGEARDKQEVTDVGQEGARARPVAAVEELAGDEVVVAIPRIGLRSYHRTRRTCSSFARHCGPVRTTS